LQTLGYRRQLCEHLSLSDVRIIVPDTRERASIDPAGDLWQTDPDACCDLRKVRSLDRAAAGFDILITGRKRHQGGARRTLEVVEVLDGSLRINPLAVWDADRIEMYRIARDLPHHPLVNHGYPSIGCWPCTRAINDGEPQRAGRWSGLDKAECGIHLAAAMPSAPRRTPACLR
jgi:phosphoadenylyl-sulfate reductase (thioredoxin)